MCECSGSPLSFRKMSSPVELLFTSSSSFSTPASESTGGTAVLGSDSSARRSTGCRALSASDLVKHSTSTCLACSSQTVGTSSSILWLLPSNLLHCSYRYIGRLKKIAMGRCVFLTAAPVLMKEAISQQEHQELLLAALAIFSVVLRARSSAGLAGCSAAAWAASSSASSRCNPRAILANRLCSCAIGFAWYFVM